MTPFEKSEQFVHLFAEGMLNAYAMLNYVPVLKQIEEQSLSAVMQGDAQLMAELLALQNVLTEQVSLLSAEA
jgi:hypothetical protein